MNKFAIFWTALSALVWSYRPAPEDLTGAGYGHGNDQEFASCSVNTDNCEHDGIYGNEDKDYEASPVMLSRIPSLILSELHALLSPDDMHGPPDLTDTFSRPKEVQAPTHPSVDTHKPDPEHDRSHGKDDGEKEKNSLLFPGASFLPRAVKQTLESWVYGGSAHSLETVPTLPYATVLSFVKQWTPSISSALGGSSGTGTEPGGKMFWLTSWYVLDHLWILQYYGYVVLALEIYSFITSAVKRLVMFVCRPLILTNKILYYAYYVLSVLLCCRRKRQRVSSDLLTIRVLDAERFKETAENGAVVYVIPGDSFSLVQKSYQ